ncbi:MAG: hypothetical protein WC431_04550, partial [Candidatus Omnitrophota bacterium]
MHRKMISFIVAMVWLIIRGNLLLAQDFNWEDISRGNYEAQILLVHPEDDKIIFLGVPGGLLKSVDAGESWRRVLSVRGGSRNISAMKFAPFNLNVIYAATDDGLYRSKNSGERWERIFRGRSSLENKCTAVLNTSRAIFAGTEAGLFISKDGGRSWVKQRGELNNVTVFNIDTNFKQDKIVYLAASCGIFRTLNCGESWERIYIDYSHQDDENLLDIEDADKESRVPEVHFVKADINNVDCIYFSGTRGVYKSLDQGKTWNKFAEYGLLNRNVRMLCLLNDQRILGLTQTGIFLYQDERWQEISFNLSAGRLSYLAVDRKGCIYVAGEKGVFRTIPVDSSGGLGRSLLREYLKYEPEIRGLQEAAIKYAEVSSEKISQWRKLAARKAILPELNIGLDRNSTDLWHWETGSSAIGQIGDDLLRRGKDSLDWDVTLRWDLGDLIWNADQTSIDVRSKLMVELRNDILDEVNKLYFERLRVKSELDSLPIED